MNTEEVKAVGAAPENKAEKVKTPKAPKAPKDPSASAARGFSQETVNEIRKLRATPHPENPERSAWPHGKLASKFDTGAGTISQIVRNRTYKDPDYKPVFDGV